MIKYLSFISLLILIFCFLLGKQIKAEDNILDNFFLIRSPDFLNQSDSLDPCKEIQSGNVAILIIRPDVDSNKIKHGEEFYIIKDSSNVIKGIFKKIITNCNNLFNRDGISFGLLQLEKKIEWSSDLEALISIRGVKPYRDIIGTIKLLSENHGDEYLKIIKKHIPADEDTIIIEESVRLTMPGLSYKYDFMTVTHGKSGAYKEVGDNALITTGFLFIKEGKFPRLLRKKDFDVASFISITDLDKNGIFEVTVHSGTSYEGSYEVRFFDGENISDTKKVLYRWMD